MMATINKNIVKPKRVEWRREQANSSTEYYNSIAWRKLRDSYIRENPLCEICLQHGNVTAAEEVHHKYRFQAEKNETATWNTFLNEDNLIALCKKCHYGCHRHMRKYNTNECYELTEEEYKQAQLQYNDENNE